MTDSNEFSLGTVETSMSPLERFQEFLESRKKRLTPQRRVLVQTVFSRHEHFEADSLVEELSYGRGERVSRPTVYRALNELVEAGLLRKIALNDRTVYEHDYGYPQHDHLHCQKCQKLIEFSSDEVAQICSQVAMQYGFQTSGHRLIVSGVCRECRHARQRRKRPVDLV